MLRNKVAIHLERPVNTSRGEVDIGINAVRACDDDWRTTMPNSAVAPNRGTATVAQPKRVVKCVPSEQ